MVARSGQLFKCLQVVRETVHWGNILFVTNRCFPTSQISPWVQCFFYVVAGLKPWKTFSMLRRSIVEDIKGRLRRGKKQNKFDLTKQNWKAQRHYCSFFLCFNINNLFLSSTFPSWSLNDHLCFSWKCVVKVYDTCLSVSSACWFIRGQTFPTEQSTGCWE